ncbi:MAG: M48 family metalloprotease [Tepidisphaerales bacterium]
MDFFGRQDVARRNTLKLVLLFSLGVLAIVVVMNVAVSVGLLVLGGGVDDKSLRAALRANPSLPQWLADVQLFRLWWAHPGIVFWTTAVTLGLIGIGALYKWAELSAGGPAVADMLGGRRVSPQTTDPLERQLLNVVEEMAIASGARVPAVYVMDNEDGINAFAAGKTQADAVIGVTRGALEQLTRDELQGVVAHEFSHIVNRDMTLNVRLIGWLHGIMCLAIAGYILLRLMMYMRVPSRGRRNDGAGIVVMLALLGLVMLVVGYVGVFFGQLVQAAVSRQREYLADAAAVEFTRNPDGLAGALAKLLIGTGRLETPQASEAAHLMFASLSRGFFSRLLATHPPLEKRIEAIAPGYLASRGQRPARDRTDRRTSPPPLRRPAVPVAALADGSEGPSGGRHGPTTAGPDGPDGPATPPTPLRSAVFLLRTIPAELREAAGDPFSARAVVLCLLLLGQDGPKRRSEALAAAGDALDAPLQRELQRLLPVVGAFGPADRLPLLELCLEPLKDLSPSQAETFRTALFRVIWADRQVTLTEYCLYQVVLAALPLPRPKPPAGPSSLYALRHDITALLTMVLRSASNFSPERMRQQLLAALDQLDIVPELLPDRLPTGLPTAEEVRLLDRVVHRIAAAPVGVRRRVLSAAREAILSDHSVTVEEAELLRALAAVFDLPYPRVEVGQAA